MAYLLWKEERKRIKIANEELWYKLEDEYYNAWKANKQSTPKLVDILSGILMGVVYLFAIYGLCVIN